ncbi:hypothetical protein BJY01DRAFT_255432 [Aspergillus pseudoustus]|uniref:Uncharacterized protein n=1 Tax=Aspergillus pseudoustus TaxID=1810923 RepID=A0ABR4IKM1_9EURO
MSTEPNSGGGRGSSPQGHHHLARRSNNGDSKPPRPGTQSTGIYIPPYAPPGTFFLGRGTVIETGLSPTGGFYVWVVPAVRKRGGAAAAGGGRAGGAATDYDFWDIHGEKMPANQKGSDDDDDEGEKDGPEKSHCAKVGDEALDRYCCFTNNRYVGVSRVVRKACRLLGEDDPPEEQEQSYQEWKVSFPVVDPVPGKPTDGFSPFVDEVSTLEIHYMDRPSFAPEVGVVGADSSTGGHIVARPGRPGVLNGYRELSSRHLLFHTQAFPSFGSEAWGAHLAPDGRWYIGVGTVIATGQRSPLWGYVLIPQTIDTGGWAQACPMRTKSGR